MTSFCTDKTLLEFNQVMTSAQNVIVDDLPKLTACYDKAKPLIPASTPYADVVNKCT
jgi:hypothetical protein